MHSAIHILVELLTWNVRPTMTQMHLLLKHLSMVLSYHLLTIKYKVKNTIQ